LRDDRLLILNGRSGSMSVVSDPTADALAGFTRAALALTPYNASMADEQPTARSLFEHVVYITGEIPAIGGPNVSKLARDFVRFSNYHPIGDTAAERRLWAVAAIAPAFTQRLAPRLRNENFLGGEPANLPPAGYLWSNARNAGLTVRNYGEFVQAGRVTDPSLNSMTNLKYSGSSVERARVFLDDLKQSEATGVMASLTILRVEDDQALGLIVEGITRCRFWPKTAIFVAGRQLLAVSPYTRRGATDDTFYNQPSVLRTIELILGMRPMTVFDAAARPLTSAFVDTPNTTPYTPEQPRQ
jgi:hypothetical protein